MIIDMMVIAAYLSTIYLMCIAQISRVKAKLGGKCKCGCEYKCKQ